jgi:tight adherence protein C
MPLIIVACIFIAVSLLVSVILYPVLSRRSVVQERLDKLAEKDIEKPSVSLAAKKTPWQDILARVGAKVPLAPKEQSKYTRMLVAAGFRKESLLIFIGSKLVLALGLPAAYLFFYALPKGGLIQGETLLYAVALAILGFILPSFWLGHLVNKRKTEIFHTLPDVLDLLTICVEEGLGIDGALVRVSENPQFKGNPLAEELKIASMETRAGKPRSESLKDVAERTMEEDVRAFVTMLVQTERFGTSLSLALRVHSDTLRTKRRQIAEEKAAKTAIKIIFPLAFFIFPALMVVLIGPAFYKLATLFK